MTNDKLEKFRLALGTILLLPVNVSHTCCVTHFLKMMSLNENNIYHAVELYMYSKTITVTCLSDFPHGMLLVHDLLFS